MNSHKITISTPFIKLDQLLKYAGIVGSGGEASALIAEGLVTVDGAVETQRGKKIRPGMTVGCRLPGQSIQHISVVSEEDN